MKKVMVLNRVLCGASLLLLLSLCSFSAFAIEEERMKEPQQQTGDQTQEPLGGVSQEPSQNQETGGQQGEPGSLSDDQQSFVQSLRDQGVPEEHLTAVKETLQTQNLTAKPTTAQPTSAAAHAQQITDLQAQHATEIAAAEKQRTEMQAQLAAAQAAAAKKAAAAKTPTAKQQKALDAQKAALAQQQAAFDKEKADVAARLEKVEAFEKMSPEDKAKALAVQIASDKLDELKNSKEVQDYLKQNGLWNLLPPEVQKAGLDKINLHALAPAPASAKAATASQKGTFLKTTEQGDTTVRESTLEKAGVGVAALGGLGGIGAGVGETQSTQKTVNADTSGGAAGGAGGAGGGAEGGAAGHTATESGQTVVAGPMLDLSKLTMPVVGDLSHVISGAKPFATLADKILADVTTSIIFKIQDSFNLTLAAMKTPKAIFDELGTVEQINAKILPDCTDLKTFIATILDFFGEARLANVTLDQVKQTMATMITAIKTSYSTLFSTYMVAQFVTLQQKVTKTGLTDFMGRINQTVQATLDAANTNVNTVIQKHEAGTGAAAQPAAPAQAAATVSQSSGGDTASVAPGWNEFVNG